MTDAENNHQLQLWQEKTEELHSLFNLERILLANFLMSAIRSSSSAFVSEKRTGENRRDQWTHTCIINHPLAQTCVRDRINTDTLEMTLRVTPNRDKQLIFTPQQHILPFFMLCILYFVPASFSLLSPFQPGPQPQTYCTHCTVYTDIKVETHVGRWAHISIYECTAFFNNKDFS